MATTSCFLLSIFLLVGAINSSKEMSPVDYWNKVLPRTPIPKSLHAFLPADFDHLPQTKYPHTVVRTTCIGLYHAYRIRATVDQLKGEHEVDFLFVEGNLKPGSKTKKLDFVKKEQESRGWPTLLPLKEAQAFPFSTSKLADILKRFSMDPNSPDASMVKQTLVDCEKEAMRGESRYCGTSLESMAAFAVSQLQTNDVQLLTYSFVNKEEREPKSRVYTVQPGVVELASHQAVVCHIESYPYAVFYCHKTTNTKAYIVSLVAEEDGSRVRAGAVCHTDTSSWNPNHASMLILGIKPGTPVCHTDTSSWNPNHASMLILGIKPGTPVCHFLSHGHFAFVPNSAP